MCWEDPELCSIKHTIMVKITRSAKAWTMTYNTFTLVAINSLASTMRRLFTVCLWLCRDGGQGRVLQGHLSQHDCNVGRRPLRQAGLRRVQTTLDRYPSLEGSTIVYLSWFLFIINLSNLYFMMLQLPVRISKNLY